MRTTRAQLDFLAELISIALEEPYTIGYAYGRPRLERRDGSVDVSPRLPTGELRLWMQAYHAGIVAAEQRRTP